MAMRVPAKAGFGPGAKRRSWRNARGLLIAYLVIAAVVGWNRDFGFFILIDLLALPVITIAGLILSVMVIPSRPLWRAMLAEAGALLAIALVAVSVNRVHDRVVAGFWLIGHPRVLFAANDRDRVVVHLESWGAVFTVDNDTYLVVDAHDALASPAGAVSWQRRLTTKCEIVGAQRIIPKFYVAVTADCMFDGVPA